MRCNTYGRTLNLDVARPSISAHIGGNRVIEMQRHGAAMPAANGHDIPAIPAGNGKGKIKLLTRQALDGRTKARRDFDAVHRRIINDISGGDASRVSTIQQYYAEALAMLGVYLDDFNARRMLGQKVDLLELCQTITTFVRVASRLPNHRVQRDVTPDLYEHILPTLTKQPVEASDV
jgi:hypothetical protein